MTQDEVLKISATAARCSKAISSSQRPAQPPILSMRARAATNAVVEKIGRALAGKARPLGAVTVIAPALGGLVIGQEVARQLGVRFIFSEKEEADSLCGADSKLRPAKKILVVEDVVTKGGRVQETIDIVRAPGGNVVGVATIVDRSNGAVNFGMPFVSLIALQVETFKPDKLPPDLAAIPVVKPGSK